MLCRPQCSTAIIFVEWLFACCNAVGALKPRPGHHAFHLREKLLALGLLALVKVSVIER